MAERKVIPKQQAPEIKNILERMPEDVASSFTPKQLEHLHAALGVRSWKKHSIDLRSTLSIPLTHVRIYYVFLIGKNRRELSRREAKISAFTSAFVLSIFLTFSALVGLLLLYLLKSALGINLFDGFSLGIWSWFKGQF
ncbi:3-phosphoshikimate 1-carboxyvinyltransferase [Glaciecola sp. 2405UD65-10]|uniref:3-phosphoshikimate 1-carboxyvinyltransferase n=1 Tax=Glaciecola sp. 2405UD65-10 TaxID=3397244 RepID=UPI003B5B0962